MHSNVNRIRFALLILAVAVAMCAPNALAQRAATQWRFGEGAGLVFHPDGSVTSVFSSPLRTIGGSTSLADRRTGELLFFSDGRTIWDRTDAVMSGGTEISVESHGQHVLALRQAGSDRRYAIFTSYKAPDDTSWPLGYFATFIDLPPSSRGNVTARATRITGSSSEGLTAIRRCDRDGYWVIGRDTAGALLVWPYDANGIGLVTSHSVGAWSVALWSRDRPANAWWWGTTRASVDGRRVAFAHPSDDSMALVVIVDFDPATGRFADTPAIRIPIDGSVLPGQAAGADDMSFSPDGRKLYVTTFIGGRLLQFDVSTNDSLEVARSRRVIATSSTRMSGLQLGPDGRTYVATEFEQGLGVIERPDSTGDEARFSIRGVSFPRPTQYSGRNLPNLVEGDLGLRRIPAPADSMCAGGVVRLRAGWVANPRWEPAATLSCATCLDPLASPDSTTTYYLYSGIGGCGPIDSATVTVFPTPTYRLGGDTLLCPGESTELVVSTSASVRWLPSDDLSCTDCRRVFVAPRTSATYFFDVTSDRGCVVRDSVHVTVAPLPPVSAGGDTTICEGASVRLHASGGARYAWSPATGLSCSDCADPVASPAATTTYRVTAWSDAGCSSSATVRVSVAPVIRVDAGGDVAMCPGTSVRLAATGAEAYRWDADPSLSCLDCADPIARPGVTTTYHVTGTSALGCSVRDSVRVVVLARPVLTVTADTAICRGTGAWISAAGARSYRWRSSSGEELCASCSEQLVTPETTTTYYVEGTSADGCTRVDSVTVVVGEPPSVTITGDTGICRGGSTLLSAGGAQRYQWAPAEGLSCIDCASPTASPATTTHYTVIGTTEAGCTDSAEVVVSVNDPRPIVVRLDRGVRVLPGSSGTLVARMDESIATDTLLVHLRWNLRMLLVDELRPSSALGARGWTSREVQRRADALDVELTRSGVDVIGGALFEVIARAFIGDSLAGEIAMGVTVPPTACAFVTSGDGQVLVDSICGMSFRLIELAGESLRLERPRPSPAISTLRLEYAVPFEGHVELVLYDASGRVHDLARGLVGAGLHVVDLDVSAIPAGIYHVRLRFDGRTREQRLVIVR